MAQQIQLHPSYAYEDGDICLRTTDGLHFRVHSFMLKLASGFFRQMLEIPRSPAESPDEAIPVNEEGAIIAYLLDLVYPTVTTNSEGTDSEEGAMLPPLPSLEFAWDVASVADKYEMPRCLAAIRAIVMNTHSFRERPLVLYALCFRWKWIEEARATSTLTLSAPLFSPENLPTLRILENFGALYPLLELHAKRKAAILRCFDLQYRDSKLSVVYQWECTCNPEEDGTNGELFARYWDAMRVYVIASLEACPLGTELRDTAFWVTKKDLKLWSFNCLSCGKLILNKTYFVKRVGEVTQGSHIPSTIVYPHHT